jgi:hypothetical protein
MSKMSSHGPFGHLQHKLCAKERPGVKLAIWLPTIKSWESTRPWCVQGDCDTPLESSQRELQVCFRPCPNWRSEQKVMTSWSLESLNRDNVGTPPWESRDKSHSNVGAAGQRKEYYMWEGGDFPWIRAVVSQVNPCCPWLVPTPRRVPKVY